MRKHGAEYKGNGQCLFTVWAPLQESMTLHLLSPEDQKLEMQKDAQGYFTLEANEVALGTLYKFILPDGNEYPDPASRFQPQGVHGPSAVVDASTHKWQDEHWRGLPFQDLILYELHVGTFTPEGTFEAIIPYLDHLVETGVNAIELMPVAQFPGERNWGYDAVYPYAVQNSYGGPEGLKKLVDACHALGIAVFLDVVYNHLGPEGNYFGMFGPYFTHKYDTPWGDALNFDGDWSDGVREFFCNNALYWFEEFHLDGLRLDAIHMVFDMGATHFWEYTNAQVKQLSQKLGRSLYMTAESDLNSPRVVQSPEKGGYDFTAQWLDDFHHASYVLLDEEGKDRYADFGRMEQLAKAYTDGFVHSGEYVKFRKRRYGASSAGVPGDKFIVFNMNHDQVGNRVKGERLCLLVNHERLKLAAAAILLSPYVPMLFMGEEFAVESPFFYFVSHSDQDLIKAVQEGRKNEFADFGFEVEPPDPQAEKTYLDSKLTWLSRKADKHLAIFKWHQHLIQLRKSHPVLKNFNKNDVRATPIDQRGLVLHRQTEGGLQHLLCLFNFSEEDLSYTFPNWAGNWTKVVDSKEQQWLRPNDEEPQPLLPHEVTSGQNIQLTPLSITVYQADELL